MLARQLRPALVITALLILLTGVIYPGIVTVLARTLFPRQANGSLIESNGRVVGSALIGQSFAKPAYFHPRPSAAGSGYVGDSSSGTNKGPTDRKLADTMIAVAIDSAVSQEGAVRGQIPADLVTSSASGLDPDISPDNAMLQAARVARVRGVPAGQVHALVAAHVTGRQFVFFGEPRVNVLALNLALDSAFGPGK
jgi:K+-transporting ATPase ATPase C chain